MVHLCLYGETKQSAGYSERTVFTLPKELAPKAEIYASATTSGAAMTVLLYVTTAGVVKLKSMGGTQGEDTVSAFASWKI